MKHAFFFLALFSGAAMPAMAANQIELTTGASDADCAANKIHPGFFTVEAFTIGGIGALAPTARAVLRKRRSRLRGCQLTRYSTIAAQF